MDSLRPLLLLGLAATATASCATTPRSCAAVPGTKAGVGEDPGGISGAGWKHADEAARIAHLHCRADLGEQAAQLELARRYEEGEGLPRDLERAAGLYRAAAATIPQRTAIYSPPVRQGGSGRVLMVNNPNARAGAPEAMYRLGRMTIEGRGVERDERRGRSLIHRAAQAGFPEAERWLHMHPGE